MRIQVAFESDVGRQRQNNEDSFLSDHELGLFVVCDGVGGHRSGEVAATKAVEIVGNRLRAEQPLIDEARSHPGGHFKLVSLAEEVVQEAGREIHRTAIASADHAGMATTLTMVLVVDDKAIMAHVGDCRLYLCRQAEVFQLSVDHTMAQELVQIGALRPESAETSRFSSSLTRSLGHQQCAQVDTLLFDLFSMDTCLLCSDGLTRYFRSRRELSEHLGRNDLENIPSRLVSIANERGGDDNITAVVFRVAPEEGKASEIATKEDEVRQQLEALKAVPLFRNLSFNQLERVRNIATLRNLSAGENLLQEGRPCDGLCVVVDGRVMAWHEGNKVEEFTPGEYFGELALIRKRPSGSSLKAFTSSRVLSVSRDDFKKLVRTRPRLGRRLQANLLDSLSRGVDRLLAERRGTASEAWL